MEEAIIRNAYNLCFFCILTFIATVTEHVHSQDAAEPSFWQPSHKAIASHRK